MTVKELHDLIAPLPNDTEVLVPFLDTCAGYYIYISINDFDIEEAVAVKVDPLDDQWDILPSGTEGPDTKRVLIIGVA